MMDVNGAGAGFNNSVDTAGVSNAVASDSNIEQSNAAMKSEQPDLEQSHRVQSVDPGRNNSFNDVNDGTNAGSNVSSTASNYRRQKLIFSL